MKTTRRGLFGLGLGALGVALLGKGRAKKFEPEMQAIVARNVVRARLHFSTLRGGIPNGGFYVVHAATHTAAGSDPIPSWTLTNTTGRLT